MRQIDEKKQNDKKIKLSFMLSFLWFQKIGSVFVIDAKASQ